MRKGRATIKDLAKALNVSVSTVSRALSNHPDVSEETRKRVQELAQMLHYSPNLQAKYLRTHSSGIVALILPEINMFFTPELMNGVNHFLEEEGYSLMVLLSDNSLAKEQKLINYCVKLAVDGVMVSLSKETDSLSHLEELTLSGIPTILLDRVLKSSLYPTISINGEDAAYNAATYLIEKGHKNVLGLFGYPGLQITKLRIKGFQKAFEEKGIKLETSRIITIDDVKKIDDVLDIILSIKELSAIFTMSDELLAKIYHFLLKYKYEIPDDISLVSISDGELPYHLYPRTTHILHSGYNTGFRAASSLMKLIRKEELPTWNYELQTQLIELGSVGLFEP